MNATAIEWHDLLAVPFKAGSDDPAQGGADCWGFARIVCGRAGLMLPDIGSARPSSDATATGLAKLVRVAQPERVGDLLFSDPTKLGYLSHVVVIVQTWPRMIGLSTAEEHGPYAWPLHRFPRPWECWRCAA